MPTITDPDADKRYAPRISSGLEEKFVAPDADQVAAMERQFAAPAATESGSQKLAERPQLGKQESEPENPMNFTGGKGRKKNSSKVKGRWWNKKRAGIAGGILGIMGGGGLLIGTISVGPLELITASRALQHSFSRNESDSSNRMSQLFKYARFKNTGDVGEMRVNFLGSKIFGSAIQQLKDIGIEFQRDPNTGRPRSMTIDQQKLVAGIPELKGVDLGSTEAKSIISERLSRVSVDDLKGGTDGKFRVDFSADSLKSSSALRALSKSSLRIVNGKTLATIKMGPLGKFFNIPSWLHPLKKGSAAAEQKASDVLTQKKIQEGEDPDRARAEANAEAPAIVEADDFKTAVTEPSASEAKTSADAFRSAKSSITSKVSGALNFTGAACIVRNTAGSITKINRDIVELPAIAAAARVVSMGEEMKSGSSDVTVSQIGAMVQSFTDENGQSIFDGKAFQSLRDPTSSPVGTDLPVDYKQAFSGQSTESYIVSGANTIIDAATVGLGLAPGAKSAICSTPGQLIGATVSLGISIGSEILTGGSDTPVLAALYAAGKSIPNMVVAMVAIGSATKIIEHYAVNDQLPQKVFEGPVGGDLLAYGSRALSGAAAITSGGVSLGNNSSTLNDTTSMDSLSYDENTKSQNIFARTFSLSNEDSLTSQLAMDYFNSSLSKGLTGIVSSFMNIGDDLTSLFSSLFPRSLAASTNQYNWGFPQYGIPDDMLNDPALADPYTNADAVAKLLDGPDSNDYINKANTCFGVSITKDSTGTWNVIPDHAVNVHSESYTSGGCDESSSSGGVSNSDWRKLIMFVFDTRTMNSIGCATGDSQSCIDAGFETQTTANTSTRSSGVSGDAKTLAQQLLDEVGTKVVLSASAKDDLQKTAAGQQVQTTIAGDGSSGLPGCTASTPTTLSPTLLQLLLNISAKYKIEIRDIVSGHQCDTGNHPKGLAADIFHINDQALDDTWWASSNAITITDDIGNIEHDTDPSNTFGLGVGCTVASKINVPSNVTVFNDSCNPQDEIHVDVRGGS